MEGRSGRCGMTLHRSLTCKANKPVIQWHLAKVTAARCDYLWLVWTQNVKVAAAPTTWFVLTVWCAVLISPLETTTNNHHRHHLRRRRRRTRRNFVICLRAAWQLGWCGFVCFFVKIYLLSSSEFVWWLPYSTGNRHSVYLGTVIGFAVFYLTL